MWAGSSAWLERSTDNRKVGSSNPPRPTIPLTFSIKKNIYKKNCYCIKPTTNAYFDMARKYLVNYFLSPLFCSEVQLRKKIQGSKLKIFKENGKKNKSSSGMPIVKCDCGAKIMVVPDLAAMDRAITAHIVEHKGADEQFLIRQILNAASEQVLPEG